MIEPVIYLGLDWGARKIGVAIGDSQTKLALPYGRVDNWLAVEKIIRQEKINQLIIGQPLDLIGRPAVLQAGWRYFVDLAQASGLVVHLVDERLSTIAADKLINHQKAAADQDAIAAMLILQSFLDSYEAHH
jgi:putative Holliday junction resolvase